MNIAFANELSMICANQGISVWNLIQLANRHPRVNILQPGPGVGGHRIAVDPWFIVHAEPGARASSGPRARSTSASPSGRRRSGRRSRRSRIRSSPPRARLQGGRRRRAGLTRRRDRPGARRGAQRADAGRRAEPPRTPITRSPARGRPRPGERGPRPDRPQRSSVDREVLNEKILIDTRGLFL